MQPALVGDLPGAARHTSGRRSRNAGAPNADLRFIAEPWPVPVPGVVVSAQKIRWADLRCLPGLLRLYAILCGNVSRRLWHALPRRLGHARPSRQHRHPGLWRGIVFCSLSAKNGHVTDLASPSNLASTRVIALAGPTAVGKSELALLLGEKIGGEIISVDSMQVYRGMDIGTAKPSAEQRRRVPHHLIDITDLNESFDVARFVQLANQAIAEIQARQRVAILCGGTGLYFQALLQGLGDAPPGPPARR